VTAGRDSGTQPPLSAQHMAHQYRGESSAGSAIPTTVRALLPWKYIVDLAMAEVHEGVRGILAEDIALLTPEAIDFVLAVVHAAVQDTGYQLTTEQVKKMLALAQNGEQ